MGFIRLLVRSEITSRPGKSLDRGSKINHPAHTVRTNIKYNLSEKKNNNNNKETATVPFLKCECDIIHA